MSVSPETHFVGSSNPTRDAAYRLARLLRQTTQHPTAQTLALPESDSLPNECCLEGAAVLSVAQRKALSVITRSAQL
jgi:hypothetical protein